MNITTVMEPTLAKALARFVQQNPDIPFVTRDDVNQHPRFSNGKDGDMVKNAISPAGNSSMFKILERKYVAEFIPSVEGCYEKSRNIAEEHFDREVVLSPFYRSSINLNMYDCEGSCHAAHIDSNPVANILCLSEGTPIQVLDEGKWVDVILYPGELFTFSGKEMMHRVPKQCRHDFRLVASMNLYFPDDCYRPLGLDEVAYGEG